VLGILGLLWVAELIPGKRSVFIYTARRALLHRSTSCLLQSISTALTPDPDCPVGRETSYFILSAVLYPVSSIDARQPLQRTGIDDAGFHNLPATQARRGQWDFTW
jgi:hypothetical protein